MERAETELAPGRAGSFSPGREERATRLAELRFRSILFVDPHEAHSACEAPDFFHDLNLDRVVDAVTFGRQEYALAPFFHERLASLDAVVYRQDVMRDIEGHGARQAIDVAAERMRTMRKRLGLASKLYYRLEKERWFLAAAEVYVDAVEGLAQDLERLDLGSRGLCAFRDELRAYALSDAFRALADGARALARALAQICYCLLIREGGVVVREYDGEADYSAAVEETFRKFQQGAAKDYRVAFEEHTGLNHVEAAVFERVALLNPDTFAALARFCEAHADFVDPLLARFDREVQFYAAWLDYIEGFRRAGLPFCCPELSDRRKDVMARDTFDIALADKLLREEGTVVCNDFSLAGDERAFVVTGPNQGGKTTFARTFGQLHYLASLGCPVPGREARLFLCDHLFTHFEREEDIATLRGKLEDDLVRIHHIVEQATPNSIVVMNEIFSSTTAEDALFLAREVLSRLLRLDLLCVCVTFFDELTALGEKTVSMVSAVDPADPARRTFKVERRPADGLAYALSIAEKHRVSARWIKERLRG
jgi:DNA mismatch repair protein MutS